MKKILITGGAGFLGSHLCKRLLDLNNRIVCLDNFYTGMHANVQELLKNRNFELIEHDVTNPYDIETDEIYNLASPASPIHYQNNPVQTTKTNIYGALNALENAKKYASKVLQASTSEIYGDPIMHPQKEEYWGNVNPIGLRSCYDEGKRCAETLFFDYKRMNANLETKVVRIFNTYGPNMSIGDGRVVSNLIVQALHQKPLTIYGDGLQTRSFCYVDDLIDGLQKMMSSSSIGPINLGNPKEYSMIELSELIIKLTKSNSKLKFEKIPEDDPRQRKPDINKAEKYLGWTPRVSLEDGLRNTIDYFIKKIKI